MLVETHNTARNASVRLAHEPTTTLANSVTSRPSHMQAILVKGDDNSGEYGVVTCAQGERRFTLRAGRSTEHRAILGARVVFMTPRALARFQSFPDSYCLPDRRTLAAKVIGNAVPRLLMQRIAEGMIAGGSLV